MATTAKPIDFLVSGVRTSAGVAVASGKVRWYNPGTLVAATAYSDPACASPASAPLVLNAAGQATLYCLEPVRVIVKDSTETITYYDDIAPLQRHDSVYVTSAGINGGVETTLENVLTSLTTNIGADGLYKESVGATARSYISWLGSFAVMVTDFGAVGDGVADDTVACQAASDRVEARGGGWVFWPKGTYKITAPITVDTAGVNHRGAGRGVAIIKNFSTTTNAFTVNLGSAVDSKMTIMDISIAADTVSSGVGIAVTNGNRPRIQNVAVAKHRKGIDTSAVTESFIDECTIESTDDNAAGFGIMIGTRGRAENCNAICATTNGVGIQVGTDARAVDCYVEKFGTGLRSLVSAVGPQFRGCLAASSTTGFDLNSSTRAALTMNRSSGCTTDLDISAASLYFETGNSFTLPQIGGHNAAIPIPLFQRMGRTEIIDATAAVAVTPDVSNGKNLLNVLTTSGGGAVAVTFNAHSTATLGQGDVLWVTFTRINGTPTTVTFNAQYIDSDGSAINPLVVAANTMSTLVFVWVAFTAKFTCFLKSTGEGI